MTGLMKRHSLAVYFSLTFTLSWGGAYALLLPKSLHGEVVPTWYGLLTFPVMLLGPAISSLALTALLDGRSGLRELRARMRLARLTSPWSLAMLVAPATMLLVLLGLSAAVSRAFRPGLFPLGFLFGPIAGFLEEIGWTGFALPRMQARFGRVSGLVVLGLVWGLWHLPVIDFLGAASPHGSYFLPFFLAFVVVVTPMRVLIGTAAARTNSLVLAQLIHASLTGTLALVSPAGVTPAQEASWYAVFGCTLAVVVAAIVARGRLARVSAPRVMATTS